MKKINFKIFDDKTGEITYSGTNIPLTKKFIKYIKKYELEDITGGSKRKGNSLDKVPNVELKEVLN